MRNIRLFKSTAMITAMVLVALSPISAFAKTLDGDQEVVHLSGKTEDVIIKGNISNSKGIDSVSLSEQDNYDEKINSSVHVEGNISVTNAYITPTVYDSAAGIRIENEISPYYDGGKGTVIVDGTVSVDVKKNGAYNLNATGIKTAHNESTVVVNGADKEAVGITVSSDNKSTGIDKGAGAGNATNITVNGDVIVTGSDSTGIASTSGKTNDNITVNGNLTSTANATGEALGIKVSGTLDTDYKDYSNIQDNITVNGDVDVSGSTNATGIRIYDNAAKVDIVIDGDLSSSAAAIVVYNNANNVNIITTGTISSQEAAIIVNGTSNQYSANSVMKDGVETYEEIKADIVPNITAWKIENLSGGELIKTETTTYEYEKDDTGNIKLKSDGTPDIDKVDISTNNANDVKKVLSSVNYIIRSSVSENGKDTESGTIVLSGTTGKVTVNGKDYETAHQGEKITINVKTAPMYKYSLTATQGILTKEADGSYSLVIPEGGGVDLQAVLEKIEEDNNSSSSQGARNSSYSHVVGGGGSVQPAAASQTGVADKPAETQGAWSIDNAGNWIFANSGLTYRDIWIVSNGRWYYLNESGNPLTGWQTIGGVQYFLSPENTSAHPFGSLYINETTPDGIMVGSTGARNG